MIRKLFGLPPKTSNPQGRYYTYALIDSRNGRKFYIGKGTGERMYQHEKDVHRLLKSRGGIMRLLPHHKKIVEIWDDGGHVEYVVIFRSDSEQEALCAESWWIDSIGLERLYNSTYGKRC